jgi:hypothetical protein
MSLMCSARAEQEPKKKETHQTTQRAFPGFYSSPSPAGAANETGDAEKERSEEKN